ncbi:hypothetical protein FALBO_16036 [Fusarium albosuccineum]|uniref:ADF-H domain-containing protein n=1 Tax=Fusarium albosuccineum TaxID=1237068 RepID=A0A8H4KPZ4_9HYPO|nr:hypothetical protein FALBO_16036 [Fusarium albosuccineum]
MSLNGLDDPKVQEAHEAAFAEPGGWFLLKYASRDEVELLGRGTGGVVEVRNNVAEYEETSPLYGFLRYRRRNVLIKYLPENCSRLIQARVAVHFNAVCERFSPYDTIFEISDPKELKDTKLSAACSLHAASGSNSSSSSSLRRRRLMEIAEEEEEEHQQRATKRQSLGEGEDSGGRPQTAKSSNDPVSPTEPVTLNSELAASPEERKFTDASTSEVPNFVGADDRPVSPSQSIDEARRMSSQSGRPELFTYSSYTYGKPKVKLGPRPSLEASSRPRTAGAFRPVSQMPSGFKLFGKGSKRNKSKDETANADDILAETEDAAPVAEEPEIVHTEVTRPATSSGVSLPNSPVMPVPPPGKPTISPEKARLMKAMKLREKKKKNLAIKAADASAPSVDSPPPSEEEPAEESMEDKQAEDENASPEIDSDQPSISNADSGIGLDASSASVNNDQASDLTQTDDSHPDSPVIASSEPEISTKASSLSESTDETLHPKSDDVPDHDHKADDDEVASEEDAPKVPLAADEAVPATNSHPALEGKIEGATAESPSESNTSIPVQQMSASDMSANSGEPETNKIPDVPEPKDTDVEANVDKDDEPLSPSSTALKIPKSKFSTQDLRSQNSASAPAVDSSRITFLESSPVIVAENTENKTKGKRGEVAEIELSETKQPKRKANIEPIRTDFSTEANLSDDESLMDELQSATLQEAKPMLVAKSPVTPVFPSPTKSDRSPHIVRTVSNPVRGNFLAPGDVNQSSARSVSSGAAYLHKVAQQQGGPNLVKKSTVGSSISQRIKALEKLSGGVAEASPIANSRERPSSAFFSVRRSREPSRSPSVVDRASSFNRQNLRTPPSRSGSRDESPDRSRRTRRDRSNSVASRLSMFEPPMPENGSPGGTSRGPESISVTAKIVRDPSQNTTKSFEPPKDPSEYNPVELKQSPLLVDHQRSSPVWTPAALSPPKETIQERRMSKEGRRSSSRNRSKDSKSRRSSLSVVKDFINDRRKSLTSPSSEALSGSASRSPTRPPSTHTKRLSISSRRSSISRDKENVLSPSATTESSASGDETKSNSDKKKSRAGRFMRRLSSLSSSRGSKATTPTVLSPTVQEEVAEPARPVTTGPPSIVSYMGDVNVQFPDNLLWKRRNMCLDSQGFLILSALAAQNGRAAQGTKRYHLSEFRTPYIPDVEVQELPNSVVLDLVDGSGVQIACVDRAGQTKILDILRTAHATHAMTFGQ